ncbi:response regulator [Echinicola sp. CAU 1574]|uniref:Response regulator n=1 Tax=Echinicola arenosa TaxID=2774144 RepID=A0ABR9AKU0_9BACT|nr:ATP-binding protein [Echinicola arenosa]MBD8488972.1 response regulator [Echinicola arenosa]
MISFNFEQFNDIFPFYMLIGKDLKITALGKSLKKLYPEILHQSFPEIFQVKIPVPAKEQSADIFKLTHQMVILNYTEDPLFDLRGQFEVISASEQLLFIGTPWFKSIEELTEKSLTIHDFANHDPSFDLLHSLKNQETISQDLKKVLETLKKQKNELKKASKEIEETALFPLQNPDPLVRIDTHGSILLANPSASKLISYTYKNRHYPHKEFWKTISKELQLNEEKQSFEIEADGKVYSFIVIPIIENNYFNIYGRDITPSVDADLALKKEVELQNILIDISSKYINIELEHVDQAIQKSLEALGEFVQADRAYIFDYDFSNETTSNTFEWCRAGIRPEIDQLQQIPLAYFPQWVEKHAKGEPFYIPDVSLLPDEGPDSLRGILEPQGVKSLITLPMIRNHKLIGFIGFDAVLKTHEFEEKERKLLFLFTQMILNITERKDSERHLKIQEEKYRNIITNMNLGILEVDNHENILYANKRFCEMAGYSLKELHGGKATDLLLEKKGHQLLEEKRNLRNQGISDNFEISVKNKAGEKKWWFVSGSPNYNDDGELIGSLGIHLDITSQKELEKELIQAKEDAEASTRAKELFLANMSHEIRTPMNAITGMINQLRKTVLDSDQTFYLNTINSAADNLLIIINDILDLSKIEAGKLSLEEIGFEPHHVLTRVMQVMGHKAEEKGIKFTNSTFDSQISNVLIGDPYRLNQILLNLISNAIKFTEKGNVDITFELISEQDDIQNIKIGISDTGIGMEEEFVKNLFKKFHQEDSSITRKFGGTGLGMSICKELVELMGGKITVSSVKNQGTSVFVLLPLLKGKAENLPTTKPNTVDTSILKDKLILVTDDNDMNRLVASTILSNYGAKILEADNGIKAIDQVEKFPVDLILMDIQMPMLDGLKATKIIRQKEITEIPIIALTAFALKGDDVKFLDQGMNDYLAKPFDEYQLLETTCKWLDNDLRNDKDKAESINKKLPDSTEKLYDLEKLKALSPGNKLFQQKMIDLFKTLSSSSMQEIKDAYKSSNREQIKKIAHRMKPSISSLGITSIQQDIRKLEEGNMSDENIQKSINKIDKVIEEVNQELEHIQL